MHLAMTPEQQTLRDELREYFSNLMTEDVHTELWANGGESSPTYRQLVKQMGVDGWLGIGWPTEYGGQGRGMVDQLTFADEAQAAGAPVPFLTLNSVGPTIFTMGSDEQKRRFLPGILAGDTHFSIGYTEPTAGTDLASLRTRAVRDGDEYVINGQKVFTSLIAYADYVWLAVRTDPEAKPHRGISLVIVPTDSPGFSWTPITTLAGAVTSTTYYEDVRVPVENLVGRENDGWMIIMNQLNHERVALCNAGPLQRSLEEVTRWASETTLADGRRVIDQEWVRVALARVHAKTELLKLVNWKIAWGIDKGLNPADASATKVFGTELNIEANRTMLEIIGQSGAVLEGPDSVLHGKIERQLRGNIILTFGGGTNEVQRDIIAMLGLGMPRAPR